MTDKIIELTTDIVASYVGANTVAPADLPALIRSVFSSLSNVEAPATAEPAAAMEKLTPAQIRKSIKEDGLVSFEDGKTYKTLKRHLTTRGMTITEYKEKWGLPKDYPSTSPSYSAQRSEMAKSLGLGRGVRREAAAPAPAPKKPRKAKAAASASA